MFSILISLFVGIAATVCLNYLAGLYILWSSLIGLLFFVAAQVLIALVIRKKITAIHNEMQAIMLEGQDKVKRKMQFFQQKQQFGKSVQQALENEQNTAIEEALAVSKKMEPYFNWNFLLKRQINTVRMQLNYQIKNFKMVDELIPKCLYMEPLSIAMKMARMYKNEQTGIDKLFWKKIKKYKGNDGAVLYGLYSWICVKQDRVDEAIKALVMARENTENETLRQNWESLANGKIKKFSNAGLGEQWYALCLEQPKPQKQRQKVGRKGGRF